jgi:hypothetical protein
MKDACLTSSRAAVFIFSQQISRKGDFFGKCEDFQKLNRQRLKEAFL